mmetsp:Transcript_48121/g.126645  ORF Transcript_48121/g.126645 Transcript_48121/m.126645 type:complete len:91 (-) Transcript_48121:705-977(-)|eukprot:1501090-Prymnesium_polylepis.1
MPTAALLLNEVPVFFGRHLAAAASVHANRRQPQGQETAMTPAHPSLLPKACLGPLPLPPAAAQCAPARATAPPVEACVAFLGRGETIAHR